MLLCCLKYWPLANSGSVLNEMNSWCMRWLEWSIQWYHIQTFTLEEYYRLAPVTTGVSSCCCYNYCLCTVPTGAPQNFTAIGVSPTSVRLQWDPPAEMHCNGKIVLYEVLYHQQKQATEDMMTNATDRYIMVDGLEPETDYNFQIRAYTAIGPGPWSNRLPFRPFPQRNFSSLLFWTF